MAKVVDDFGLIANHLERDDTTYTNYRDYEIHCSGYSNIKCELGRNNIKEKDTESQPETMTQTFG